MQYKSDNKNLEILQDRMKNIENDISLIDIDYIQNIEVIIRIKYNHNADLPSFLYPSIILV